jgi:gliding motility-associated protein GldL
MKTKKLDIFNFFYSIGAVIILIGVIAKFLEWKAQDVLLLTGLSVEALVFTMSSIQFKTQTKEYHWERLFPELVDKENAPSSLSGVQARVEEISKRYHDGLVEYVTHFEMLNNGILKGTNTYQESLEKMSTHLTNSAEAFADFKGSIAKVTDSFLELHAISTDIKQLQDNLQSMTAVSIISGDKLNIFQEQLQSLNDSIFRFNMLSSGIISQFKQIGN